MKMKEVWGMWLDAEGNQCEGYRMVPAVPRAYGGHGTCPSYEGRANEHYLHWALTGKTRLIIMTHLAVFGATAVDDIVSLNGINHAVVSPTMWALHVKGFVERVPGEGFPCSRRYNGRRWIWLITAEGRKWLWRFGWVTRRLLFSDDAISPPLRDDVPEDPLLALKECASPYLMRPTALCIAAEVLHWGPFTFVDLVNSSGISENTCNKMLRRLSGMGWIAKRGDPERRIRNPSSRIYVPVETWSFTPGGTVGLGRHVDAMRRMSWCSGHAPERHDICFPFGLDGEGFEPHADFE